MSRTTPESKPMKVVSYETIHSYLFVIYSLSHFFTGGKLIRAMLAATDSSSVAGATIILKGTTFGTVTDKNGFYKINKINPGTYTLRVSFIGFETQEKSVTYS